MKKHHVVLGVIFLVVAVGNWVYAWQRDSKAFAMLGIVWLVLAVLRFVRARGSDNGRR